MFATIFYKKGLFLSLSLYFIEMVQELVPHSIDKGEMRMFTVYYLDGKNVLLNQLRKSVPNEGEEVKIKGRKGKVTSVTSVEESKIHVQVELESVNKAKLAAEDDKKKRKKR